MSFAFALLAAVALAAPAAVAAGCSHQLSSCSCQTDDGGVVDLRPLAGGDGSPAFEVEAEGQTFQFNPCVPFTCDTVSDSAVCQRTKVIIETFVDFGTQSSAAFDSDSSGRLLLRYASADRQRNSVVVLVCDSSAASGSLTVTTEQFNTANFVLTSAHACPTYSGLSVGDVLLIVVFSLLVAYLVIGALVNRLKFGESGIQMIPNLQFWCSLPGLVVAGFEFSISQVRARLPGKSESYQQIK